jgi:hypothetical protein
MRSGEFVETLEPILWEFFFLKSLRFGKGSCESLGFYRGLVQLLALGPYLISKREAAEVGERRVCLL